MVLLGMSGAVIYQEDHLTLYITVIWGYYEWKFLIMLGKKKKKKRYHLCNMQAPSFR